MQNKIKIHLKFKAYEFRRVKHMGTNPVLYTTGEWVGKEVLIIPMPINVTDRWIEKQLDFDETINDFIYDICVESHIILKKVVSKSGNTGRVYMPKELVGLDCLIIEAPFSDNF